MLKWPGKWTAKNIFQGLRPALRTVGYHLQVSHSLALMRVLPLGNNAVGVALQLHLRAMFQRSIWDV